MASKKRKNAQTENVLSLILSPQEKEGLNLMASKNGVSTEEYARMVLISSIPLSEQAKILQAPAHQLSVDQAYEALERMERGNMSTPAPSPIQPPTLPKSVPPVTVPARRPPVASSVTPLREQKTTIMRLPQVPPGPHPCFHLSTQNIPGHLQGQCQGICKHYEQAGRICYWTPTTARQCDFFEMRRV